MTQLGKPPTLATVESEGKVWGLKPKKCMDYLSTGSPGLGGLPNEMRMGLVPL